MASLLIIVFVVELAVAVVNAIGAATINNLVRKYSLRHAIEAAQVGRRKEHPRRGEIVSSARATDRSFVLVMEYLHLDAPGDFEANSRAALASTVISQSEERPRRYEQPGRIRQVG